MEEEYTVTLVGGPPWGFRTQSSDNGPLISQLHADGRGKQEGINLGDYLLKVNGKEVQNCSHSELQRHLRKATGILRLNLKKGSGIPHVQSEPHSLNKKQTVVLHQPNHSFGFKEKVQTKTSITKDVGLMVDIAKKKFFPQTAPKPFKVISLPENQATGYMSDADMPSFRTSRWNPFTSGSLGTAESSDGRPRQAATLYAPPVVKTGRPIPPIKRSGRDSVDSNLGPSYMYSAPATPLGPLSPSPSQASNYESTKDRLGVSSELSTSHQSLASSAAMEMDNYMSKADEDKDAPQLNICTSPVPSCSRQTPPLAITIATAVKRVSSSLRNRGRSTSISKKGLQAVHENIPMKESAESSTPTLTEGEEESCRSQQKREATDSKASMADSALGISPDENGYAKSTDGTLEGVESTMYKSALTDKSTSTSVWTASQMSDTATSPIEAMQQERNDDRNTRPVSELSAISDHPSLASGTIDIDSELQSRSTTTDLDAIFENSMDVSGGTQYDISSSFTLDSPTMPMPCLRYKQHNHNKKVPPLFSPKTEDHSDMLKEEIAHMTQALSDLNKFEQEQNDNEVDIPDYPKAFIQQNDTKRTDTPKPFGGRGSSSRAQPATEPPSHTVSTTVQMNSAQQGRWLPSHSAGSSVSANPTSPIPGYTRINFYAPIGSSTGSSTRDPYASQSAFSSPPTANTNAGLPLQMTPPIPPTPPLSLSSVALPTPAPPPPPPPSSSATPSWKHKPEEPYEPVLPDHERSTIEYPEKQTVAALKHAIEHKLNGSAPVKGAPPMVDIASDSGIGTPTSSTAPILPTPPLPPKPSHKSVDAPPPPLQLAQAVPQLQSSQQSPQAPPRPPLPTDLASPFAPHVPPSPTQPVTYTSPSFEPYRGGSVPVSRQDRSPPRGAVLMERKSSIEGNQVRTDSYYAIPHKEVSTQRRQPHPQPEYGRNTPSSMKQPPSGDHGDFQHHWYKMMYRKLHQIDKDEDQSVLRYRMRDYRTPPRDQRHNAAHLYGRALLEPEPEPYSHSQSHIDPPAYRYQYAPEHAPPGLDYEPGWWPQGYSSANAVPASRRSMPRYDQPPVTRESSRSMRSKSAGRYEVASPLPSDVVKGTPANEQKYYKIQPKRIDQYIPGESSLARFEAEEPVGPEKRRPASAVPFNYSESGNRDTGNLPSGFVLSSWRRERERLNNNSLRQRSNSATGRGGYPGLGHSSRYYYGMEDDRAPSVGRHRHEMSPPNRDQVRDWYRSIQHGGEVPYAGLRQHAPERRDSYMRAILYLLKQRHQSQEHSASATVTCDQSAQTSLYLDKSDPVTSSTSGANSSSRHSKIDKISERQSPTSTSFAKHKNYGTYFKRVMDSSTSTYQVRSLTPGPGPGSKEQQSAHLEELKKCLKNRPVTPPILCSNQSTGLYAVERSKVNDFHIPTYRSSPERRPQYQNSPWEKACKTPADDLKWSEIEAFFEFLNRDDKSTWTNGNGHAHRSSLVSYWWQKELESYLKQQAMLRKQRDAEYLEAWDQLNTILHDIELMTPESAKSLKCEPRRLEENVMQKSSSFPEGLQEKRLVQPTATTNTCSTKSFGGGGYTPTERFGLQDRTFCFPRLMRQFERFEQSKILLDRPRRTADPIGSKTRVSSRDSHSVVPPLNLKQMPGFHSSVYPHLINAAGARQDRWSYGISKDFNGYDDDAAVINLKAHTTTETSKRSPVINSFWGAALRRRSTSLPELAEGVEAGEYVDEDMCRSRSAAGFVDSRKTRQEEASSTADYRTHQLATTQRRTVVQQQRAPENKTMASSYTIDYSTTTRSTTQSKYRNTNPLVRSNSLSDLNNYTLSPGATRPFIEPDSKESWTLPRFMLPTRPAVSRKLSASYSDLSLPDQTAQAALSRYQYRQLRDRNSSDWKYYQGDFLSPHTTADFNSTNSSSNSAITTPTSAFNTPEAPPARSAFDPKSLTEFKRSLSAPPGGFMLQRFNKTGFSNQGSPTKVSKNQQEASPKKSTARCEDDDKEVCMSEARHYFEWFTNANTNQLLLTLLQLLGQSSFTNKLHTEDAHEYTPRGQNETAQNAYSEGAATPIIDESPYRTFEQFKPPMEFGTNFYNTRAEQAIEDERRKRQEREIYDQRSRRHGYTPLPALSPGISGDRYQTLTETYAAPSSAAQDTLNRVAASNPDDLRGVAKAIYSFSAHNMKELSFRKGDLIRIRRIIDPNWYEGEIRGVVGLVPVSYVELAAVAEGGRGLSYTEVFHVEEGQAQALYNFDGTNLNELPLRKGDVITVTKRIDSNWLEGKSTEGRVGILPTSYVRIIKEPATLRKDFSAPFGNGRSRTPKREEGDDSSSRLLVNGLPAESPRTPLSQTQALDDLLEPQSSSRPVPKSGSHGLDVAAWELKHTTNRLAGQKPRMPQNADTYQAVFSYRPQNADELELREGDIVYVVEKCDDGWFIGTSLRTGVFGTFPGNYVQLMR